MAKDYRPFGSRGALSITCFGAVMCASIAVSRGEGDSVVITKQLISDVFMQSQTELKSKLSGQISLDFLDDGPIISRPDGHVQVGFSDLTEKLALVKPAFRLLTLRFILLHELWHQVQFREQGRDVADHSLFGLNRFLECEADIMASRYLGKEFIKLYNIDPALYRSFYQDIFDIGELEEGHGTHPSVEHRKLIVQRGLFRLLYDENVPIVGQEPKAAKGAFAIGADIRSEEPVREWGVRECGMITRADPEAIGALSRLTPTTTWDTGQNHLVRFAIPYKNVGSRPMRVDLAVMIALVDVKSPKDLTKRELLFGRTYTFDLAPAGTYVVQGSLPWIATESKMPQIVYPPDVGGLVRVRFLASDSLDPAVPQTSMELTPEESTLAEVTKAYANHAVTDPDFSELRSGDPADRGTELSYVSKLSIPGAKNTRVILGETGEVKVEALFQDGSKE